MGGSGARYRRCGRQTRPARGGSGAQCGLRGRLPRILIRLPTKAQPARCAGRVVCRDRPEKNVSWILDVDIRSFFDHLSRDWLVRFLKHRIADKRLIRLVRKWLQAGVLDEGVWTDSEAGVPQGATASPLLANVYLHYSFDLWVQQWRKRHARRGYGRCAIRRRQCPRISIQERRRAVPGGYA